MISGKQTTRAGASIGNVQVLITMAMFVALSIILGKQLAFTAGPFRFSFENLTILMAGLYLGPVAGLIVGACADIIGCLWVGYAVNPVITAGAASIGLISGLVYRYAARMKPTQRLALSVAAAHIIGSMVIKSIGLKLYFGYPLQMVALRVPLYIVIACAEGYLIHLLMKNRAFSDMFERLRKR